MNKISTSVYMGYIFIHILACLQTVTTGQGLVSTETSVTYTNSLKTNEDSLSNKKKTRQSGRKRQNYVDLPAIEHLNGNGIDEDTYRKRRGSRKYIRRRRRKGLALWIDNKQVQLLSGYPLEIYVIREGKVLPYIRDPKFDARLPVIPAEVTSFNFTWQGGKRRKFRYRMDKLISYDRKVMDNPTLSIPKRGKIPRKPKSFSIDLPCLANKTGTARFSVRLRILKGRKQLHGIPISVTLRKKCAPKGSLSTPGNCPIGYTGHNCSESLCYTPCMNGGTCIKPGVCSCRAGYHGRYCQREICTGRCQNGGKCVQKDKCACPRGFYGEACQFSKCSIPCLNGGICRGANKCKCPRGYGGQHCEVLKWTGNSLPQKMKKCIQKCRHGECDNNTGVCVCREDYAGRWCRRKMRDKKERVWL